MPPPPMPPPDMAQYASSSAFSSMWGMFSSSSVRVLFFSCSLPVFCSLPPTLLSTTARVVASG